MAEIAWQQMNEDDTASRACSPTIRTSNAGATAPGRTAAGGVRRSLDLAGRHPQGRALLHPGQGRADPAVARFPDMERHSDWHTAPRPIDGSVPPPEFKPGQLGTQLVRRLAVLGDPGADRSCAATPCLGHPFDRRRAPALASEPAPHPEWRLGSRRPRRQREQSVQPAQNHADPANSGTPCRSSRACAANVWRWKHAACSPPAAPAPMAPPEHCRGKLARGARHGYPRETESPVMINAIPDCQQSDRRTAPRGRRLARPTPQPRLRPLTAVQKAGRAGFPDAPRHCSASGRASTPAAADHRAQACNTFLGCRMGAEQAGDAAESGS